MNELNAAPLFPAPISFDDIDETVLAREEATSRLHRTLVANEAWSDYLRKTLPPLARQAEHRSI